MEQTDTKLRTSKRRFVISLVLLLLTNILMGATLMTMSKKTLREEIDQRMLDIANVAAHQLDGDVLKTLTAEDEGTEAYNTALETLRSFQDNIELDYIYGIREEADGSFTFTIDPAVVDPGEFGSPIQTTAALQLAARGTPSVDKESYTDAWGRFYSAYSPVFDSEGNVAGIVGVDFNADWYDGKINSHRAAAVVLILATFAVGMVLASVIMSEDRKRFNRMSKDIEALDAETRKLDQLIMQSSIKKLDMLPDSENTVLKTLATDTSSTRESSDVYDRFHSGIESVTAKLHKYLVYVDSEVYTDSTTGVNNKAAYKNRIKAVDEAILAGNAAFSVAFFDINGIKKIYTRKGFEAGDRILCECAKLLKDVYGKSNVYHVTGDEFIVILDGKTKIDMTECSARFEEALERFNKENPRISALSVSKGAATYDPEQHIDFRHVFIEAKAACDKDKDLFYGRKTTTG